MNIVHTYINKYIRYSLILSETEKQRRLATRIKLKININVKEVARQPASCWMALRIFLPSSGTAKANPKKISNYVGADGSTSTSSAYCISFRLDGDEDGFLVSCSRYPNSCDYLDHLVGLVVASATAQSLKSRVRKNVIRFSVRKPAYQGDDGGLLKGDARMYEKLCQKLLFFLNRHIRETMEGC